MTIVVCSIWNTVWATHGRGQSIQWKQRFAKLWQTVAVESWQNIIKKRNLLPKEIKTLIKPVSINNFEKRKKETQNCTKNVALEFVVLCYFPQCNWKIIAPHFTLQELAKIFQSKYFLNYFRTAECWFSFCILDFKIMAVLK